MNKSLVWAVFYGVILVAGGVEHGVAASGIIVAAGELDRRASVVSFRWEGLEPGLRELEDSEGNRIPIQVEENGWTTFVLPELGKGTNRRYRLTDANSASAQAAAIEVKRRGTKLQVTSGGKLMFEYQAEPGELPRADIADVYRRGGYLHPVVTPSGRLVTDHFARNHLHQQGIWFSWTKAEFEGRAPDFWNMGQGKGRVDFLKVKRSWGGAVHGGLVASHAFVDLTVSPAKVALNEEWEIRAYQIHAVGKPYWLFDLRSEQRCASASPLRLPRYHYGGLGVRGNWDWNGKDRTFFMNAERQTDRIQAHATRSRWCHMGGEVDGALAGIAILGHPGNFRAPQPMRIHPTEPFFCYAPSQGGDWSIEPGQVYVSRYRFVVADGGAEPEELDRLWADYAHPVAVQVEDSLKP